MCQSNIVSVGGDSLLYRKSSLLEIDLDFVTATIMTGLLQTHHSQALSLRMQYIVFNAQFKYCCL